MADRSASDRAGRAGEPATELASQQQEGPPAAPSGARCAAALAVDPDLLGAAESAAARAVATLAGASPDLACVFGCGADPDALGAALSRAAEIVGAPVSLGCSASGVIGGARGVEATPAVSVWAARLEGSAARSFHLEVVRGPEGLAVVGMPEPRTDDTIVLLLADPYSFPVDAFVERSTEVLGGLPLAGGLALGPRGSGSARLLLDGRVVDRGAVGVVLGGGLGVRTVVSQGCRPIGPPMTVTGAEGNLLLGLAGSPALSKLREVLASAAPEDQALATSGLQLGVAMDEYADEHGFGDFLVRGVLGVDAAREALAVGDVLTVGQTVRFHVRDAQTADADLRDLLARFRASGGLRTIDGALLFSCNGRGAGLFDSADHDPSLVSSLLGEPGIAGFFAAGEIGPVGGRNHVHGFTASLVAFGAASAGASAPPR